MLPHFRSRSRSRSRSGSRDGVALIIVLAFIVLTSILIVSFIAFSSSNRVSTASYAKAIQAQEIAQGGLQDILNDLHQEIAAGSTAYTVGSTTVYVPTTNYTASPQRLGYNLTAWGNDVNSPLADDLSPSLVRVSRASQSATKTDLYPPMTNSYFTSTAIPLNRASAASTATPSSNGRSVTFARWNKSLLLSPSTAVGDPQVNPYAIPGAFATNYTATTNSFLLSGSSGGDGYSSAPPPYGPPDWVYVTRGGSRALTTADLTSSTASVLPSNNLESTNAVIGRYAYIIYDEGALLNINVAGFPQTATNASSAYMDTNSGITQTINGKTLPAYADLSIATLFGTASSVTSFVNWRNAAGLSNATNNYLAAANIYSTNGFLSSMNGDSPLVSRQDLINYMINADPPTGGGAAGYNSVAPTISKALPYLGTFSRSLSAPTWFPTANAPAGSTNAVYNYASNAENTTTSPFTSSSPNPNADLATLRWPGTSSLTITHYYDNATSTTYTVNGGTQFLQNRFSLAKIAWLSQANPDTGAAPSSTYATAIKSCFGLVWGYPGGTSGTAANGGNQCWTYSGSTGTTAGVGSIETLYQVAQENREPNFFEILKAAILSGSVGVNTGPALFNNGVDSNTSEVGGPYNTHSNATKDSFGTAGLYNYTFGPLSSVPAPARISDTQIIQIGANIIDQFDSDSYPTAIYFPYTGVGAFDAIATTSNPLFGPIDMFYGDENLPLLDRVTDIVCSDAPVGNADPTSYANNSATTRMAGWFQPEVWNPHQASFVNTTVAPPSKFQLRAYGSGYTIVGEGAFTGSSDPVDFFQSNTSTETSANGTINITDPSYTLASTATNSPFFAHPYMMNLDMITNSTTTVSVTSPSTENSAKTTYPYYTSSGNHFVAFWAGTVTNFVVAPSPATGKGTPQASGVACNSYAMGWLDSSNKFHPYSFLTGAFPYAYSVIYPGRNPETSIGSVDCDAIAPDRWALADPRTGRFSLIYGYFSASISPPKNTTTLPDKNGRYGMDMAMPSGPGFYPVHTAASASFSGFPSDWSINSSTVQTLAGGTVNHSGSANTTWDYYADSDGVIRPADGINGQVSNGGGMQAFLTAGTVTAALGDTVSTGDKTGVNQNGRRPIILNRPFRNVGELGYTFRDLPFKTLDFFSASSADAALLDVFSVQDETRFNTNSTGTVLIDSLVAGRINPNNSPLSVLEAIFSYASKKDLDSTYNLSMSVGDCKNVAKAASNVFSSSTGPNPILNRAGLVTTAMPKMVAAMTSVAVDKENKPYFEAPIRALSNNVETRSWSLLIDVIAQSGHFSPAATSLDNFIVDGEKRYWLHVAIDRYTGKIIDQQLEPVYE